MRTMTSILCLIAFLFTSGLAWAHPAKRIDLTFDSTTKMLTAKVVHDVKDNYKHYTKTVEIKIVKKGGLIHNLIMQDDINGAEYIYKLNDVVPGDTISLTTTCVIFGKKTATITVK
jgi:hypothetical protein